MTQTESIDLIEHIFVLKMNIKKKFENKTIVILIRRLCTAVSVTAERRIESNRIGSCNKCNGET